MCIWNLDQGCDLNANLDAGVRKHVPDLTVEGAQQIERDLGSPLLMTGWFGRDY
jgi:hypothetical protein